MWSLKHDKPVKVPSLVINQEPLLYLPPTTGTSACNLMTILVFTSTILAKNIFLNIIRLVIRLNNCNLVAHFYTTITVKLSIFTYQNIYKELRY